MEFSKKSLKGYSTISKKERKIPFTVFKIFFKIFPNSLFPTFFTKGNFLRGGTQFSLKEGAILIADVHYGREKRERERELDRFKFSQSSLTEGKNSKEKTGRLVIGDWRKLKWEKVKRKEEKFLRLLEGEREKFFPSVENSFIALLEEFLKFPPSQLILVGDIFHILLPFNYVKKLFQKPITLLEQIAEKTEVYYLEGNHDFQLTSLFRRVKIVPNFLYDPDLKVIIAHGDLTAPPPLYRMYSSFIRNNTFLKIMGWISFYQLEKWVFKLLLKKPVRCTKISNFREIVLQREWEGWLIEGHYHQNGEWWFQEGNRLKRYSAIPSFYCTNQIALFQFTSPTLL